MTGTTPEYRQLGASARKTRRLHCAILAALSALVIGVYAWSAKSLFVESRRLSEDSTYYNLLVDGFRAGQLNLKTDVPLELVQLDERSDLIGKRFYRVDHHPLTDVSYYHGKLYLYFGVTPAVLLFWPYLELTGHHLFHKDALLIFFSMGFLASVGLLWGVWQRHFASVGIGVVAACALAVGLANFTLPCLPRGGVYEVSISCGYALTMVTLLFLWRSMHAARAQVWWLAGASLAYGLAVGARPSLLIGAVILLVPVAMAWRKKEEPSQRRKLWPLLLAATVPILLVGLGLLLYNFLRFDNPFEFGWCYQLSWTGQQFIQPQHGVRLFSPWFFWFNAQAYFLAPAHWSGRFPFVHHITLAPLPAGHRGIERVFGMFAILPLVWLALAAPLIWRGRLGEARGALRGFGVVLVLLFGSCALTLCLFFAAYSRYQVEFLPALVWLAVLGILGLERALASRPKWRWKVRWGWGLLVALAVAFNGLATITEASALYVSRGVLFFNKGQMDEAMAQYQEALALQSDNAEAHSNFGTALFQQGKVEEAIVHFKQALQVKPDFAEAHNNLGMAMVEQGRVVEAIVHYEQALQFKPDSAGIHNNLGAALSQLGRVPEAIGHLEWALQLRPESAPAHAVLATALLGQGKVAEAIANYEQALRVEPANAETHNDLGAALVRAGRVEDGVVHLERALQLKPDFTNAHTNLAVALAQLGHGMASRGKWAEAIAAYERCIAMSPDNGQVHDALGMALSQVGRLAEAVRAAQKALELSKAAGQAEAVQQIQGRLQLYQAGRPYHEGAAPQR